MNIQEIKNKNPIIDVAIRLGLPVKARHGTQAISCIKPDHNDKSPSMLFYPDKGRFNCVSCGFKGDVIDLVREVKSCSVRESLEWLEPDFATPLQRVKTITPKEYIKSRNLTKETLEKFNIQVKENQILIPLPNGIKVRNFGKQPKYKNPTGKAQLFKTQEASDFVILCEGEMDAVKLWQETHLPVWSGTTGAKFKDEYKPSFKGIEKIFIGFDSDEEGQRGMDETAQILGEDRCYKLEVPYGKDWTEAFQLGMTEQDFLKILDDAKTFESIKNPTLVDRLTRNKAVKKIDSGFEFIDETIKGFRIGGTYLVSGLEKSGKSSFLLCIVKNLLIAGKTVGFINTELVDRSLFARLTALEKDVGISETETDDKLLSSWAEKYQENFKYAGIGDLTSHETGLIDFKKTMVKAKQFVDSGVEILFFDNLTTYNTQPTDKARGWEILAKCLSTVVNFTKQNNVVTFCVIHTKPQVTFTETQSGVRKLVEANEPQKIFEDTATVIRKPSLSDTYGGGGALSQLHGSMIVWRPYQKFNSEHLRRMSGIILDSFRDAPSGVTIKMEFDGAKGQFKEDELAGVMENLES